MDLQAPAWDVFGAFTEFLLISGRSPATVKNYLSAVQILFQEWRVADVVKDLSSPAWNLTLRAISYSAGPQPYHRSAVTKHDLIKLVAVCNTDRLWFPLGWHWSLVSWLSQDFQPRSPHSKVLRFCQAFRLVRRQTKQRGHPSGPQVDQDAPGPERSHYHPHGGPPRQEDLPSFHLGHVPAHAPLGYPQQFDSTPAYHSPTSREGHLSLHPPGHVSQGGRYSRFVS